MQRVDMVTGLGGQIAFVRFTLTFSDLTASATTQNINLLEDPSGFAVNPTNFSIPLHGKVLGATINTTTAFTGGGLSSMTLAIGTAASSYNSIASAQSVYTGFSYYNTGALFYSYQDAADAILVRFTCSGNVNIATAGSVDVYLAILNCSTPI